MRKHAAFLVFVAALTFFSIGAASRGLWEADEHRIAEVAREMALPGGDWIVPHKAGEVYTDKPPLVMWIVAFVHGVLGADLGVAAKVPGILGGALAVLGTFLVARRLYGESVGVAAAAIVATAAEFDWICRRAQYDPLVAGFTTLALWFFVKSHFPRPEDDAEEEHRPSWGDAIAGSLCVGMGILTKGPVALVYTVPVVLLFALLAREPRTVATPRAAAVVLALVPGAIWLAAAVARAGLGFAEGSVVGHAVAHAAGDLDKVKPWWFHLVTFPEGFAPWTLFLPAAVFAATSRRRDVERRADLFVLSWFVAAFLLMSLTPAKRPLYLLPLYPAAAIGVARSIIVADQVPRAAIAVPRILLGSLALVAGLATVVVSALVVSSADGFIAERIPWWTAVRGAEGWAGPVLAILAGIPLAAFGWKALRETSGPDAMGHLLAAAIAGSFGFAAVGLPCVDPAISPRPFYEQVAALVGPAPVALFGVDDFAPHWILRRTDLRQLKTPEAVTRFLGDTPGAAFVVAERRALEDKGAPPGTRIVFEKRLPLGEDLVLLAR